MDAVTVELVRSSLFYASEEMGIALRNASYSPNIKERMDHSAAIFDHEGRLLAQAEHIPVHLGSLPWGLRNTLDYCGREGVRLEDGSMIVVNNPYIAGTHLNDVTVVSPVYSDGSIIAYVANKAHHSDVGGKVPGSISTDAQTLSEEGVIIDPCHLMRRNEFVDESVNRLADNSRTPTERKGDLRAQAAANITGERRVQEIISKYGRDSFIKACDQSIIHSERLARNRLSRLRKGAFRSEDFLEGPDGKDLRLKLTVKIDESGISADYSGTDLQVDNPLNAIFGVTISGVYFVIRTIIGDDIPANHGAFAAIAVHAPPGTILNPTFPHPVAGGNLETSQRNADLLYKAFAKVSPDIVPADSYGCMNNVMLGGTYHGKSWAFYETIGGGLGAQKDRDGIDGIQGNMTNTMNTPIEEIERTLPIRITRYEFRPNSSGAGKYRGGSGIIRSFQALRPTTITVVSDRARHAPSGLLGGNNGEPTKITLSKTTGRRNPRTNRKSSRQIPVKTTLTLNRGERIEVHTAGGGGYGEPTKRIPSEIAEDIENGFLSEGHSIKSGYAVKQIGKARS